MQKFRIEQFALQLDPARRELALRFLRKCGIFDWVDDTVVAVGSVGKNEQAINEAELKFNYDTLTGPELELLNYTRGENWLDSNHACASHIGMHCTEAELADWRVVMREFSIEVAQEVRTVSHSNPRIRNCRRYHYVVFKTRHLIGIDMKFIVRSITDPVEEAQQRLTEVKKS